MFRVMTLEDECEFLKISIANFIKVKDVSQKKRKPPIECSNLVYIIFLKKIEEEEKQEKFNAIKKCPSYSSWPKHTIEELMNLFEWRDFPQNTSSFYIKLFKYNLSKIN